MRPTGPAPSQPSGSGAAVIPCSASFALPPSGAVRTSRPSSVSATECSQCEDHVPSVVMHGRVVLQHLGRRRAQGHHRLDGQAEAGDQLRPLAAPLLDVVQQVRLMCISVPMPWPP